MKIQKKNLSVDIVDIIERLKRVKKKFKIKKFSFWSLSFWRDSMRGIQWKRFQSGIECFLKRNSEFLN